MELYGSSRLQMPVAAASERLVDESTTVSPSTVS